jgi:hypothetical protein
VDDATTAGAYNRYAYCGNDPLGHTDPSGFFSLKSALMIVAVIAISIVTAGAALAAIAPGLSLWGGISAVATASFSGITGLTALQAAVIAGAAGGFAGGFAGSLLNGGSLGDAFKAGIIGGITGAISAGIATKIGDFAAMKGHEWFSEYGLNHAAHGISQGLITEATGGEFRHGFYAAALTSAVAGPISRNIKGVPLQTAAAAVVGGTASAIGGGKFANGAVSGAFTYLFNQAAHPAEGTTKSPSVTISLKAHQLEGTDDYAHAFVEIRDNLTGDLYVSRAGPSKEYPGGIPSVLVNKSFKGVLVQADDAVQFQLSNESVQMDLKGRKLLFSKEITTLQEPIDSVLKKFNDYAHSVNKQNLLYRPRTINSNAYAFGAIETVTGVVVAPDKRIPGSGERLIKP